MGKKIYAVDTVFGYRTDTLANWQAENPVLYRGEPVIVSDGEDGNWLKIGDGMTPFNDLPYMRGPQGPRGEKGKQGIQGVPGENGKDADVSLIANALKGNKSGEIVSMTDVSPIEHNVGVKVKSKNCWNHEYDKKDLTNGTFWATPIWSNEAVKKALKPNTTYTISYTATCLKTVENASKNSNNLGFNLYGNSTSIPMGYSYANNIGQMIATEGESITIKDTFTTPSNLDGFEVIAYTQVYTTPQSSWVEGTFSFDNILLEEGTTATTYTPYVEDLSAVSVKRYGKNLCELGTVVASPETTCTLAYPLKKGVTYWVSAFVESTDTEDDYCLIRFYDSNWSNLGGHWIKKGDATFRAEFTPTSDAKHIYFLSSTDTTKATNDTATFKDILITPKGNDAKYEPFIEPTTYTPNENGIVEGVTSLYPSMTLTTDSGVIIDAEYNRDINKAFAELQNAVINMGGVL